MRRRILIAAIGPKAFDLLGLAGRVFRGGHQEGPPTEKIGRVPAGEEFGRRDGTPIQDRKFDLVPQGDVIRGFGKDVLTRFDGFPRGDSL